MFAPAATTGAEVELELVPLVSKDGDPCGRFDNLELKSGAAPPSWETQADWLSACEAKSIPHLARIQTMKELFNSSREIISSLTCVFVQISSTCSNLTEAVRTHISNHPKDKYLLQGLRSRPPPLYFLPHFIIVFVILSNYSKLEQITSCDSIELASSEVAALQIGALTHPSSTTLHNLTTILHQLQYLN